MKRSRITKFVNIVKNKISYATIQKFPGLKQQLDTVKQYLPRLNKEGNYGEVRKFLYKTSENQLEFRSVGFYGPLINIDFKYIPRLKEHD